MKINKLLPSILLSVLLTTAFTCKSPSGPEDKPNTDTTSHNFTWQVDTIGFYQSIVRDVAIINENNIWAVGRFHKKHSTQDSTENDRYGLAKWNGIKWQLQKMHFVYNGEPDLSSSVEPDAIWIISENEVWMATGRTPIRIKNGSWKNFNLGSITTDRDVINKIWAKDANNVYFVGNNGTIIYYNGSTFTKLNYIANIDFLDVWGDESGVSKTVSFVKSDKEQSRIVKLQNGKAETELLGQTFPTENDDLPGQYISIWWKNNSENYWVASDNGVFFRNSKGEYKKILNNNNYNPRIATVVLRGEAGNDLFMAGIFGQLIHWNGNTLHLYTDLYSGLPSQYSTLSVKGNVVCAGGYAIGNTLADQTKAIVAIGKRL